MNQAELLASRYGKKPRNQRRERTVAIGIGAIVLAVFLYWAISVVSSNAEKITGTLVSYSVVSQKQVSVEIRIDKTNTKSTYCQVEALSNDYEVVGYKEVELKAQESTAKTEVITVKPAVSAVVKDCWLK